MAPKTILQKITECINKATSIFVNEVDKVDNGDFIPK